MRHPILTLASLLAFAGALVASAATAPAKKSPRPKAPNPVYAPVTDVAGLPRVLLLGDSISIGYTLGVRAKLAGRANVHRPPENCGDTARGVASLDKWLGTGKWEVIHFNFGLHDLKFLDAAGKLVPPDQGKQVASLATYEANLRTLVARLKKTGAKLVFATTTPVPAGSGGRVEDDSIRYNAVALRVMQENGVALDDLHAFVKPHQAQWQRPANVHFTDEGSAALAGTVVAHLLPLLPPAQK